MPILILHGSLCMYVQTSVPPLAPSVPSIPSPDPTASAAHQARPAAQVDLFVVLLSLISLSESFFNVNLVS